MKVKKYQTHKVESTKDKTPVVGMVERGGNVKAVVTKGTGKEDITPFVEENVSTDANVYTDEWTGYNEIKLTYDVESVKHNEGQYVVGNAHTNTIEGFWSQLKRSIIGVYHHISVKHLQNMLMLVRLDTTQEIWARVKEYLSCFVIAI